ncbi:MAG: hypothetical protein FWE31_02325 [Firmicutes bacterium]|nr:hypothetical protein [Bacillota bacterium]
MKKLALLSLVLTLAVITAIFSVPNASDARAETFWDEIDGIGTATNPFLIRTAHDLRRVEWFSKGMHGHQGRTFEGQHFRLMNSLDLSNHSHKPGITTGFSGIGNATYPFMGVFDGGGNTIRVEIHFYQNQPVTVGGVFNIIQGAVIRNLNVDGFVLVETTGSNAVTGTSSIVGGLFGRLQGNIPSIIENITINADVRVGSFANTAAGTPRVGGLGGQVQHTYNDDLGVNAIYSRFEHITINANISGAQTNARVGGVLGEASMARLTGSNAPAHQRAPTRIYKVILTPNVIIETSGALGHSGGLVGRVAAYVKLVAADVDIANVRVIALSGIDGVLVGHVEQSALVTGVNVDIHEGVATPLVHAVDDVWLSDKLRTFRFTPVPNIRVRNMTEGDRLDVRPAIFAEVIANQEEVHFHLNAVVRHTDNKSLVLDFNTKLIVHGGGRNILDANLVYNGVIVYTHVFEVRVRMAWPTWLNLLLVALALGVLFAVYQLFFLKKYKKLRRWRND